MSEKINVLQPAEMLQHDGKQELGQMGTSASTADFDPQSPAIGRIRRKIDLHLVPLLSALYLVSFLDRVNIGNAKVAGITADLNISPSQYNWCLSIFFVGYVIAEIPSNLMLKKVGPRKWITFIMVLWGAIMMLMAACKSASGLLAARFFLGMAESGLFPGTVFLISLFYARGEQSLRNGIFFSTATIAGAFGGVLAYYIEQMDGVRNLHGWQWIFILEGLPCILLCIVVWFFMPNNPETAYFLTEEERVLAARRLVIDAGPATETHLSMVQFWAVFKDWKVYMHMITYILSATPLYSLSLFIPSIVLGFKFSPLTTQVMTAPAYVIACLFTIGTAYSSDRFRERGFHYAGPTLVGCLGYILLIVTKDSSTTARYISLTVAATGVFASVPAMLSWFTTNIGGHTKRGVATAAIISFGNLGGIVGGQVYRADDAPQYVRGHTICACMMFTSAMLTLLMKWLLIRENRRRDNLTPEQHAKEAARPEPCDLHPDFRYVA